MIKVLTFIKALTAICLLVVAFNAFTIAKYMYSKRAVVKGFTIEQSEIKNGFFILRGYFDKVRDCEFKEVVAMVSYDGELEKLASVEFLDQVKTGSRPEGGQYFGPWRVEVKEYDNLDLYARHYCDGRTVMTKMIHVELD